MKQEQLLDDTRESEIVDRTLLFLLVVFSVILIYLSKIARLTVHSTSPFDDNLYIILLNTLGFVAGAFISYFFCDNNKIVFIGFLMVMIFCIWDISVLSIGNYFDNWAHIYLLELGEGIVSCSIIFRFLRNSKPFGKKQTDYIFLFYLSPFLFTLMGLNQDQYILPENTGWLPIAVCFLLMVLSLFILLKRKTSITQEKLHAQLLKSPKLSIVVFWILLSALLYITYRALISNIPAGLKENQFFYNSDLMYLGGTVIEALFASVLLLKWGAFPYRRTLNIGVSIFCSSVFIYCIIFYYNQHLNINYLIFQILIQFIYAGGYIMSVSFLSYLISFSGNKYYIFFWVIHLIPNIFISLIVLSIGFIDFLELLRGNIFYIILPLTAISSLLFLLYLNRTNNLIPDDERTDRLQP